MSEQTLRQAEHALSAALTARYGTREAGAIARAAVEELVGRTERVLQLAQPTLLTQGQHERLAEWTKRLVAGEPLQYVTGRAEFMGLVLEVSPAVLIPRPETEELVLWALETLRGIAMPRIVDVGTGSGCIALALKARLQHAEVLGLDVSEQALAVARRNAERHRLDVAWQRLDVLGAEAPTAQAELDMIVSNPPYIPPVEAASLDEHVREYEPHLALFTPTEDALVLYRRLAQLAPLWLRPGGWLVLELHAPLAEVTRALFSQKLFSRVELRPDLQGRPRLLRVQLHS